MRLNFLRPLAAVLLILTFPGVSLADDDLPPLPPGPLILTSVKPEQLKPDYWINLLPEPDKVLKTPAELKVLNDDTHAMVKDYADIFKMPVKRNGYEIRDVIEREYGTLSNRKLFGVDDVYILKEFFEREVKPLEQWEQIPNQISMKWGAAVRAASVRALPTDVKMLEQKGDVEFDQLQFTQIKTWTPVGIFHASSDGKWLYIQAPYSRGWVKAKDISVFPSRDELKKYVRKDSFLVITADSAPVSPDENFESSIQPLSMGTVLPLEKKTETAYVVTLPRRGSDGHVTFKKGYIALTEDVSEGFPSFTQRNIINQAFKLLGARYGWGGTYNGRDCSGFTQDVFLSFGLAMPRSSKGQGFVGTQLGHYVYKADNDLKTAMLDAAVPGTTILRMPSHMMLYLGKVDGQYYVIHSTWAERYSMTSDAKNRINQVVVSDLTLNGRSHLGPLFDRIISANEIN